MPGTQPGPHLVARFWLLFSTRFSARRSALYPLLQVRSSWLLAMLRKRGWNRLNLLVFFLKQQKERGGAAGKAAWKLSISCRAREAGSWRNPMDPTASSDAGAEDNCAGRSWASTRMDKLPGTTTSNANCG